MYESVFKTVFLAGRVGSADLRADCICRQLALDPTYLDTNNLDRLIPSRQRPTDSRRQDLVHGAQALVLLDAFELAQRRLGQTGKAHTRAPVGRLTDRHRIDTLVDTGDTLATVDIHKDLERAFWRRTGRRLLVTGDLDCLHARTEACRQLYQANTHP